MKASNLALPLEDEITAMKTTIAMMEEPPLSRTDLAKEANESLTRRPRLSLQFKDRHLERSSLEMSDQGMRLFRVR